MIVLYRLPGILKVAYGFMISYPLPRWWSKANLKPKSIKQPAKKINMKPKNNFKSVDRYQRRGSGSHEHCCVPMC